MKIVLAALTALLLALPAQAQPRVYQQAELDALLAPIALHPDGVLSQVLMAATYPDEVAAAARWSRANPAITGDDAVRAVYSEPWDPSVKALVAFPDLLARMGESPQWVHDLGDAFLAQEAQVMETVQALRRRAQASGYLAANDHQAVYPSGDAIVVQPRTQVVYVPYYDPYVVYGPWWWPHYRPVFWRPWAPRPVFVAQGFFYSRPDWHQRHVRVVHRPAHAPAQVVVPGRWTPGRHHAQPSRSVSEAVREASQHPSVRQHVRTPESQRRPIVQSAPHPSRSVAEAVREATRQPMPAANGFSQPQQHQRRDWREDRREPRAEMRRPEPRREAGPQRQREERQEHNRGHGGQRQHRG